MTSIESILLHVLYLFAYFSPTSFLAEFNILLHIQPLPLANFPQLVLVGLVILKRVNISKVVLSGPIIFMTIFPFSV